MVHQRLTSVQWLFFDPSVLLNENDTDREVRRQVAAALARRGHPVDQEQVERAWMQAVSSARPCHPLSGTVQILAPDTSTATAIFDEVVRSTRNLDTLFSGVQMALHLLQGRFKLGIIGPYRLPGTRSALDRFHLNYPVVALSDELNLSHKLSAGGRPDSALFTWALRKAGCPAEHAAFASDRVDLGLGPAKSVGMTTIWLRVTNYKLRYPRTALEAPDITCNGLSELAQLAG